MKRYGEAPKPNQRYTVRTGAYAILPSDGSLLLTYQDAAAPGLRTLPEPEYQLPGGGIDPGESPGQALIREVCEETGWRIGRVRRLGAYRRFTYMPEYDLWAEKICLIYMALPVRRLGPPTEPGHSAVWMTPADAMRELANSGDREFVRQYESWAAIFQKGG